MEQGEGSPSHLPAASATATATGNGSPNHADGDPVLPPETLTRPPAKRRSASSTAWPDIGSSFQNFAAKQLPESATQAVEDVVCQIGREDGLVILSATEMLGMYHLQNIGKCDVVDSFVFELWTNNDSSEAQPTRIRLQSDRAGDLLDAVTAATMELMGFTNWMYLIKYGSEVDNSGGSATSEIFTTGCAPLIPPHNSAATDPKEVYPLGKIIRAGEWRYLRDIIELKERGEEVNRC